MYPKLYSSFPLPFFFSSYCVVFLTIFMFWRKQKKEGNRGDVYYTWSFSFWSIYIIIIIRWIYIIKSKFHLKTQWG